MRDQCYSFSLYPSSPLSLFVQRHTSGASFSLDSSPPCLFFQTWDNRISKVLRYHSEKKKSLLFDYYQVISYVLITEIIL